MRWEWMRERERHDVIKEWKKKKEEGESGIILITEQNNIYIYIFCLALINSAYLSIDVHCSNGAKKNRFSSTAGAWFWCLRN